MKTFQRIARAFLEYEPDDLISMGQAAKMAGGSKMYFIEKEKRGYIAPVQKGTRGRNAKENMYLQKDLLALFTVEWRKKNALKRRRKIKAGIINEPLKEYRFKTRTRKMWMVWYKLKDDDLINAFETFKKLGWIHERLASRWYYDLCTSSYKLDESNSIPNQYKRMLKYFGDEGYEIFQDEYKEFMIKVGDLKDYLKRWDLRVAKSDIEYEKKWLACNYGKAWIKHKSLTRGQRISKKLLDEYGAKGKPSFYEFENQKT